MIVVTGREQWRELYGKDCPKRWFEPRGVDVLEVETMADELTLFGKPMKYDGHGFGRNTEHWFAVVAGLRVFVTRMDPDDPFYAEVGEMVLGPHATPEVARDDAEATLRALYEALGDVVEPWVTDRDPPAPAFSTCDDAYLCSWDSEYGDLVGEAMWDGTVWYGDGHSLLNKPHAWRPMPKAPGRKV